MLQIQGQRGSFQFEICAWTGKEWGNLNNVVNRMRKQTEKKGEFLKSWRENKGIPEDSGGTEAGERSGSSKNDLKMRNKPNL